MAAKTKSNFSKELIKFYTEFLVGSANAIATLAKIEKDYPKEYKLFRELKDDPITFSRLTKMPEEIKDAFLIIILEGSSIGQRANKLFDLSRKEKEDLVKDMREFAKKVEDRLGTLLD